MILQYTFPRATVLWILIAQALVYVPHFREMPLWLTGLYFSCLAWRYAIFEGRWSYPNKWLKGVLIIAAFASVLASFQTISGARGGVALLLLAFAYKTLEMKEQRDAYLVIMLAYFVVACGFLYQRSFVAASYMLFCIVVISAALISMNHLPKKNLDLQGLWMSAKMLLQAIPLMIFLFVFFPQLPPLFQMGLGGKEATTGLSDTMNPGSIAMLTESQDLVFRVKFEGDIPERQELYWRAQVFERFDGISWKVSDKKKSRLTHQDVFPLSTYEKGDRTRIISYEIFQEASQQTLLFSLPTPWVERQGNIQLNSDFTLSRDKKVESLFRYTVESNLDHQRDIVLSDLSRSLNLTIPLYGNERARTFAEQLREQSVDDEAFMNAVLDYFFQQGFEYSLYPPLLGANPVDEFVFETRKGFCEHFASSFVYMMRAGGVPARIVAGYHGGEYNSNGDYLLIHQFEAHAWAEVWFAGEGWRRVDPTAWIAPDRINQGLEQALPEGESLLDGNFFSSRRFDALTSLRLQLDYFNMQWDKWVLGYNEDMQAEVLKQLLGKVTAARIAMFMALCFAFVVLSTALAIYLKDFFRVRDPADRLYLRMQKKLRQKYKINRAPGETPNDFARRVAAENEAIHKNLELFTRAYIQLKYMGIREEKNRQLMLRQMKKALSSL